MSDNESNSSYSDESESINSIINNQNQTYNRRIDNVDSDSEESILTILGDELEGDEKIIWEIKKRNIKFKKTKKEKLETVFSLSDNNYSRCQLCFYYFENNKEDIIKHFYNHIEEEFSDFKYSCECGNKTINTKQCECCEQRVCYECAKEYNICFGCEQIFHCDNDDDILYFHNNEYSVYHSHCTPKQISQYYEFDIEIKKCSKCKFLIQGEEIYGKFCPQCCDKKTKKEEDTKRKILKERKEILLKHLSKYGIKFDKENNLFLNYINKEEGDLDEIVNECCKLKFLNEYCSIDIKNNKFAKKYDKLNTVLNNEQFKEFLLLKEMGGYPNFWPWLDIYNISDVIFMKDNKNDNEYKDRKNIYLPYEILAYIYKLSDNKIGMLEVFPKLLDEKITCKRKACTNISNFIIYSIINETPKKYRLGYKEEQTPICYQCLIKNKIFDKYYDEKKVNDISIMDSITKIIERNKNESLSENNRFGIWNHDDHKDQNHSNDFYKIYKIKNNFDNSSYLRKLIHKNISTKNRLYFNIILAEDDTLKIFKELSSNQLKQKIENLYENNPKHNFKYCIKISQYISTYEFIDDINNIRKLTLEIRKIHKYKLDEIIYKYIINLSDNYTYIILNKVLIKILIKYLIDKKFTSEFTSYWNKKELKFEDLVNDIKKENITLDLKYYKLE